MSVRSQMWITSDLHLFHTNIINFSQRPFKDAKEMNEALIDNWNAVVKPQDHVYNLGDVTMLRGGKKWQHMFIRAHRQLGGHKRLILGNHDHFLPDVYKEAGFEKILGTGQWFDKLLLSHYPVHESCVGSALANVHGHIHQHTSPPPKECMDGRVIPYINVCVEMTDYQPIAVEEVMLLVRRAKLRHQNQKIDGLD